jgi:hypothetical protein
MVDILSMVDLTSISAMLAAIGVLVGVVFAILELRNLVKTRQTDLVIRLYSTFGSKEFQEDWAKIMTTELKDYVKVYGPEGSVESWSLLSTLAAFFEGVGVLAKRKLIDLSLVDDLLSTPILWTWEKIGPVVEDRRERLNRPQIWEWFEYLYNEMKKREQQLATIQ